MRVPFIASALTALIKLKILNIPTPLVVYWSLTDRCNLSCKYCIFSKQGSTELSTAQVFSIIDEMAVMGTKRIVFTGGESLLREDIGNIVNYAFKKNILSVIISNGYLVPKKIKELRNLGMFMFSLDGPPEINDYLRGKGAHEHLMQAIQVSRDYGLRVHFITVLSSHNLNCIDYLLKEAERLKTTIGFQPVLDDTVSHSNSKFIPSIEEYKKTISRIMAYKKRYNGVIRNSLTGLQYLIDWPEPQPIKCSGGLFSCRIDTNGDVGYCNFKQRINGGNCANGGFKYAFKKLSPITCYNCYCGMKVELNYLLQFDKDCIINFMNIYKKLS